ncbi:MAG: biopolymer transporter ExbD [Opitutaceae bacterium]
MARSFHRKQRLTALSELNVTSLIDLGFALLIIFMISTPLIKQEETLPVDLPVTTNADAKNQDILFREITVLPGGYLFDGTRVNQAQLETQLQLLSLSTRPPVISIKADRNIAYQEVVTLLDLLKRNKLSKISLDTQPQAR